MGQLRRLTFHSLAFLDADWKIIHAHRFGHFFVRVFPASMLYLCIIHESISQARLPKGHFWTPVVQRAILFLNQDYTEEDE